MLQLKAGLSLIKTVALMPNYNVTVHRNIHRWVAPTLKELRRRKERQGPDPVNRRSDFIEWNYGAELFAFAKRLKEDFDKDLLRQAFTLRSFTIQEERKQAELGIEDPIVPFKDHQPFLSEGQQMLTNYINTFLIYSFPQVPEDGIKAFHDFLVSAETLAHVSSHIGTKDLILTPDAEPKPSDLADVLKALVYALQKSSGDEKTFLFVRDFILTQLNQKDLNEIWVIEKPFKRLKYECKRLNLGEPEPRSLGDMAKNTILACSRVGIYCDKKLLSTGFGEDAETAIEAAALGGLNKIFDIEETRKPLNFSVTLAETVSSMKNTQKENRRI